ncbi:MAG: cysteine desulfurase family protein [Candidatus Paceibacterota bacterium]
MELFRGNIFRNKKRRYYWDTAAATKLEPVVKKVMSKAAKDFGNPSSLHREGILAQQNLFEARKIIARLIAAQPAEIIFTSGGTESNNLAILGTARAYGKTGHLITTMIEHKATLEPFHYLEKEGYQISYLPVSENGLINPKEVEKNLKTETFLLSIIYANNEIGAIQPIKEVVKVIRRWRKEQKTEFPYLHIDACQAPRFLNLNVLQLGVDLMTVNGSKIFGPKGVGFLYVRRGVELAPIILGGGQETGRRSGSYNTPAIVGLAKALEICELKKEKEILKLTKIRDYLAKELLKIPEVKINSSLAGMERLPNILNFSVEGLEGEQLVLEMDKKGFAISAGSACSLGVDADSQVMRALGYNEERQKGAVRVSLPREAKISEAQKFIRSLNEIIVKYHRF